MSVYLKVKAKSLQEEGRIIQREKGLSRKRTAWLKKHKAAEQATAAKLREESSLRWGLHHHKSGVVRREARATHLARNFLKGNPYRVVEQKTHPDRPGPDWDKVQRMVVKYSDEDPRVLAQRLAEWMEGKHVGKAA